MGRTMKFVRQKKSGSLFAEEMQKGCFFEIDDAAFDPQFPILSYRHSHGELWAGDAIAWLRSISRGPLI